MDMIFSCQLFQRFEITLNVADALKLSKMLEGIEVVAYITLRTFSTSSGLV